MMQEKWEEELENAMTNASPAEALIILQKIKGWTLGYCSKCGQWSNWHSGRKNCECISDNDMYGEK